MNQVFKKLNLLRVSKFRRIKFNKLKEKNIIKELDGLDLDGLDFKCIYEALTDCPSRFDNYPCLNVCTDGKPSHLSK